MIFLARRNMSTRWKEHIFSIDMITGKRHRRQMHELDLNKLEVVAPHWHDKVAKYRKKGGTEHIPKYDYTFV